MQGGVVKHFLDLALHFQVTSRSPLTSTCMCLALGLHAKDNPCFCLPYIRDFGLPHLQEQDRYFQYMSEVCHLQRYQSVVRRIATRRPALKSESFQRTDVTHHMPAHAFFAFA